MRIPFRWWVAALLFIATTINYLDRQTFSIATPEIAAEFGLSNVDVSWIIFAFTLSYTVGQLLMGKLMDVTGARIGFVLIMAIWSAAGMATAAARSVLEFGVFRFVLGIGESGNWPVSVKTIAEWFPACQRSLGIAFFTSGTTLGNVVAPLLIGQLIIAHGWRTAFVVIGAVGFLWIPLWLVFYRSPADHPRVSAEELAELDTPKKAESKSFAEWVSLLRYRQVWGVTLVRFFTDSVLYFYIAWLPKYLADERAFTMEDIRDYLPLVFVPTVVFAFIGGGVAGKLIARGWSVDRARKIAMLFPGITMCSSVAMGYVESDGLALAIAATALCSFYAISIQALTLPTDLVPPRLVGSVSGLSGFGAGFGFLIFNYAVGQVADLYGFRPVFVMVGLLPIGALLMLYGVMGKIERVIAE